MIRQLDGNYPESSQVLMYRKFRQDRNLERSKKERRKRTTH